MKAMDFVRGLVVRSLAGHDKGGFFAVLSADSNGVIICDGKRRTLDHPKLKKPKHLAVTNSVLDSMNTDREIRRALRPFYGEQG